MCWPRNERPQAHQAPRDLPERTRGTIPACIVEAFAYRQGRATPWPAAGHTSRAVCRARRPVLDIQAVRVLVGAEGDCQVVRVRELRDDPPIVRLCGDPAVDVRGVGLRAPGELAVLVRSNMMRSVTFRPLPRQCAPAATVRRTPRIARSGHRAGGSACSAGSSGSHALAAVGLCRQPLAGAAGDAGVSGGAGMETGGAGARISFSACISARAADASARASQPLRGWRRRPRRFSVSSRSRAMIRSFAGPRSPRMS